MIPGALWAALVESVRKCSDPLGASKWPKWTAEQVKNQNRISDIFLLKALMEQQ